MDLSQLQAFDQVVRQGNFSKAARLLNISQPTISLRIQALEQKVGGALFLRGGNRMCLTELGRAFLPYARQAINALNTGVDIVHHTKQGKRGRIVIGTLPSLATHFFSSTLSRLRNANSNLDITVHTGHSKQIVEMLYDGLIHVGFITWPFFIPDLSVLLHLREPLIVVTYAGHPLTCEESVDIAEFRRLADPFFQIDWCAEANMWGKQITDENGSHIELPPQTAHDLLLRGVGVALFPRSQIQDDLKTGHLVEVNIADFPALQRQSTLVRLGGEKSVAIHSFIQILYEEAFEYWVPDPS